MTTATLFGLCAAALVGLGLYGFMVEPQPLRKVLSFNLLGGGVFLLFGVMAKRGGAAFDGDPVPQALVITGLVVALAVALILRLVQVSGHATLGADSPEKPQAEKRDP
jgi:multicomponent Na+:H+ antiporter subunit C